MSNSRQASSRVRSYAITHPPGRVLLPTQPGWDRLVYAWAGSFVATTDVLTWTVPVQRALCVPDGSRLAIHTKTRVAIRCLYFDTALEVLDSRTRAIALSPLARELVASAVDVAPMSLDNRAEEALIDLLTHELAREPDALLHLALPTDPIAEALAENVIADPSIGIDEHIRNVGASRRTMERRFKSETQLTLGQWHRRARVLSAVAILAAGESVTETALLVGYSSPSSFTTAFRRELDASPRGFIRSAPPSDPAPDAVAPTAHRLS